MTTLKVPSLQHLARNWHPESRFIQKNLVRLVQNPPMFNYNPLFSAVHDLLVLDIRYAQVAEGIRRGVKRQKVQQNFLEVLSLIRDHFENVSPSFCHRVDKRYYPIGRGLFVPFQPPLIYSVRGEFHFPWFSFWRSNPLAEEQLSLFVTLVDEVLFQDPDLENAKFEVLDFSAPKANARRNLKVIDVKDIPRVNEKRKIEMLEVFAEGYFQAQAELASSVDRSKSNKTQPEERNSDQPGLFD